MQNIKSGSKQNSTFYHYIKTTNEKHDYCEVHNNLIKNIAFIQFTNYRKK